MAAPTHIVILCSRLDLPGGIEKAIVNTANLFIEKKQAVTLVVLDTTKDSFYPVHPSVKIIEQPLSFGITSAGNVVTRKIKLLSDVLKLRKIMKVLRPDFIIATEYPFAAAAILTGAKKYASVVSWEHHHFYELEKNLFWNKLFRLTYPRLNAIICLNKDEQRLYATINSNPVVIPNFVEQGTAASLVNKLILTVGRLTPVKGTDLLLQTACLVLKKHPDWQWKLIGDGEMKATVTNFINTEKLDGKLILQQPVSHTILTEYQQSSLYVMTSRNECFPMTLLEAQSVGLPCISFDCETGPRHIITHNQNGLLAEKENPAKLADAISLLINEEDKRQQMGNNALVAIQQFSPEKVYQLWHKLFEIKKTSNK